MFKSAVCDFPQNKKNPHLCQPHVGKDVCVLVNKRSTWLTRRSVREVDIQGFWGSPRGSHVLWSVAERGRGQWGFRLASVCQQPPACDALVHIHADARSDLLMTQSEMSRRWGHSLQRQINDESEADSEEAVCRLQRRDCGVESDAIWTKDHWKIKSLTS